MSSHLSDTIAALATAPAPAGVAIVRISGEKVCEIIPQIFVARRDPTEEPRTLIYGDIVSPKDRSVVDRGMVAFFPGPESYTGDDLIEVQMHGSPILISKILAILYDLGVRAAEPGEFTKRAFLNGKMDLVQAEAVSDLILSGSDVASKIARDQLQGRLSSVLQDVGEPLRDTLAEIEAHIDFPEEEISPDTKPVLLARITEAKNKIEALIESYSFGAVVKDGFRVLLSGPPNAGKSSLLNALLGSKRAIVTEVAGTTRDLIEERAQIKGYSFIFCDSAGMTETKDVVEKIGVELAWERVPWADLVLFVVDSSSNISSEVVRIWEEIKVKNSNIWLVLNKSDLASSNSCNDFADLIDEPKKFKLSASHGSGIKDLQSALLNEVSGRLPVFGDASAILTNARHNECLNRALRSLNETSALLIKNSPLELISGELRIVLSAMEELIGKTWSEDILGRIFSKFCIGK